MQRARTPTASPPEKSEKYQGRGDRTCQLVSREIPETISRIPGGRLDRGGGCLRAKKSQPTHPQTTKAATNPNPPPPLSSKGSLGRDRPSFANSTTIGAPRNVLPLKFVTTSSASCQSSPVSPHPAQARTTNPAAFKLDKPKPCVSSLDASVPAYKPPRTSHHTAVHNTSITVEEFRNLLLTNVVRKS